MRRVLRLRALVGLSALTMVAGFTAVPAGASDLADTLLPQGTVNATSVYLTQGSPDALIVATGADTNETEQFLLTPGAGALVAPACSDKFGDIVGRWKVEERDGTGALKRCNVVTGEVQTGPVATGYEQTLNSGDGWLLSNYDGSTPLLHVVAGGASTPVPGSDGFAPEAASSTAAVGYLPGAGAVEIDYATGATTTLAPGVDEGYQGYAKYTNGYLAWVTSDPATTYLHWRKGPAGALATVSDVDLFSSTFTVSNSAILWKNNAGDTKIAQLDDPSTTVTVSGLSSTNGYDIKPLGDGFVVSTYGSTQLGTFSFASPTVAPYLSAAPLPSRIDSAFLENGVLQYGDSRGTANLWKRSVSTSSPPALGAESLVLSRSTGPTGISGSRLTVFRLDRASGQAPGPSRVDMYDGGQLIHSVQAHGGRDSNGLVQSGPFTYSREYNSATGWTTRLYTAAGSYVTAFDDAFAGQLPQPQIASGPMVVFPDRNNNAVWLRDFRLPASDTNPSIVVPSTCFLGATCAQRPIALRGTKLAYADQGAVNVYDLVAKTTTTRAVAISGDARITRVVLGDGLVSWSVAAPTGTGYGTFAGDLGSGPVTTVTSLRSTWPVQLDGKQILWRNATDESVHVSTLDIGAPAQPLMLGEQPSGPFNEGGNWTATFDVNKPLSSATLQIRNSAGALVRTLVPTNFGTELFTVWNGRTTSGAVALADNYTYTLVGTAADGGGTLVATGSTAAPTGAILVRRVTALTVAAPASAKVNTAFVVSGKLVRKGTTTGVPGKPVRLLTRVAGTSAWTAAATANTSSTGAVAFSRKITRNTEFALQFLGGGVNIASISPTKRVLATVTVTGALNRSTMALGQIVTMTGSVSPAHPGKPVKLQELVGGVWRDRVVRTLSSSSTYSLAVKPTTRGTHTYRTVFVADSDHTTSYGPNRAVKVT